MKNRNNISGKWEYKIEEIVNILNSAENIIMKHSGTEWEYVGLVPFTNNKLLFKRQGTELERNLKEIDRKFNNPFYIENIKK